MDLKHFLIYYSIFNLFRLLRFWRVDLYLCFSTCFFLGLYMGYRLTTQTNSPVFGMYWFFWLHKFGYLKVEFISVIFFRKEHGSIIRNNAWFSKETELWKTVGLPKQICLLPAFSDLPTMIEFFTYIRHAF